MMQNDQTQNMDIEAKLRELDLATQVNSGSLVTVTVVAAAGKVRYRSIHGREGSPRNRQAVDTGKYLKDAKTRSIRSMQEIVRANKLDCFVTLTFSSEVSPHYAMKNWQKIVRSKTMKGFRPYLVVFEDGAGQSRVHLHMLTVETEALKIQTNWPYGHVYVQRVPFDELDAVCRYIGKDFAQINRPTRNRYFASKGSKPARQRLVLTSEETLYDVVNIASDGRQAHSEWMIESGLGKFGSISWNPHTEPDSSGSIQNIGNSYYKRSSMV